MRTVLTHQTLEK